MPTVFAGILSFSERPEVDFNIKRSDSLLSNQYANFCKFTSLESLMRLGMFQFEKKRPGVALCFYQLSLERTLIKSVIGYHLLNA